MNITNKVQMYALLKEGKLGNTIPQYFSLANWFERPLANLPFWGVRSMIPMDKRSRLNLRPSQVIEYVIKNFGSDETTPVNISPMIDPYVILRAEFYDSADGFVLEYIPPEADLSLVDQSHTWRNGFAKYRQRMTGIQAQLYLQQYMTANDWEDMQILRANYPGHVIEVSVCDRSVGVVPFRNTIVWEVRNY